MPRDWIKYCILRRPRLYHRLLEYDSKNRLEPLVFVCSMDDFDLVESECRARGLTLLPTERDAYPEWAHTDYDIRKELKMECEWYCVDFSEFPYSFRRN